MAALTSILESHIWPTALNRRNLRQLTLALRKEGLKLVGLISSVSGEGQGKIKIMVTGEALDLDTRDVLEFDAVWEIKPHKMSNSLDQFNLLNLEIFE